MPPPDRGERRRRWVRPLTDAGTSVTTRTETTGTKQLRLGGEQRDRTRKGNAQAKPECWCGCLSRQWRPTEGSVARRELVEPLGQSQRESRTGSSVRVEVERFEAMSLTQAVMWCLNPEVKCSDQLAGGGTEPGEQRTPSSGRAGGGPPGVGWFTSWRCGGLRVAAQRGATSEPFGERTGCS